MPKIFLATFLIVLATSLHASAQDEKPRRPARPDRLVSEIIDELAAEARAAKEALALPTLEADYASRSGHEPEQEEILGAITRRLDRDAFVDAYVRWQLTSFDPELPEMSDRVFARFMDVAPPMVENPKADPRALALFERAEAAGSLPEPQFVRLQEYKLDLDERERIAKSMNLPAEDFRAWASEKLGKTGPRPRQWLIEELSATVAAGWSAATIKGQISREFSESVTDETFTADQRRMVIGQLTTLVRPGRRFVYDVAFLANRSINLSVGTTEVNRGDLDNWADRLAGRK